MPRDRETYLTLVGLDSLTSPREFTDCAAELRDLVASEQGHQHLASRGLRGVLKRFSGRADKIWPGLQREAIHMSLKDGYALKPQTYLIQLVGGHSDPKLPIRSRTIGMAEIRPYEEPLLQPASIWSRSTKGKRVTSTSLGSRVMAWAATSAQGQLPLRMQQVLAHAYQGLRALAPTEQVWTMEQVKAGDEGMNTVFMDAGFRYYQAENSSAVSPAYYTCPDWHAGRAALADILIASGAPRWEATRPLTEFTIENFDR